MEFINSGKVIAVFDYCFYISRETLLGSIRKAEDGGWVFNPTSAVTLTSRMLRDIAKKLSELNKQ